MQTNQSINQSVHELSNVGCQVSGYKLHMYCNSLIFSTKTAELHLFVCE